MEVFEAVRTILAVRSYQNKPVPPDLVQRIIEAGRLTGSSMNLQPWRFIVIEDRNAIRQIGALTRTGPYVAQAPLLIVVAIENKSRFAVSDASRAIQSMMLTAWAEGVGSNWVGFVGLLDPLKPPLNIPQDLDLLAERHMVYSPKGDRIAYSIQLAGQGNVSNLYIRAADGSGADQPLVVSTGMHKWYPTWSPDARTIVFHINDTTTQARDLWFVNVADGKTGVLVDTPATEALPRMSPDGRFVAYQSDESGKTEIWVTTFPKSSSKWKVSTNGGTWAKWGRNEVFYWEGNQFMVVKVNTSGAFRAEAPQKLFTGVQAGMGASEMTSYNPEYDISADGTKIIVSQRVQ